MLSLEQIQYSIVLQQTSRIWNNSILNLDNALIYDNAYTNDIL